MHSQTYFFLVAVMFLLYVTAALASAAGGFNAAEPDPYADPQELTGALGGGVPNIGGVSGSLPVGK